MRWKLLIVASLLAAVVGAGACFAVAYALSGGSPAWWPAAALVAPLGATAYASVFVYRHTARRRTLQAAATALLALLLMLTALVAASLFAGAGAPLYFTEPAPPASAS